MKDGRDGVSLLLPGKPIIVIKAGDAIGMSLCGKWGFYGGPTEQCKDDSPDNCAECKKRLEQRGK